MNFRDFLSGKFFVTLTKLNVNSRVLLKCVLILFDLLFDLESIELEKFSLGNRTPYLKYFRVYDLTEDQRKMMATEVIYRNPPVDLPIRPKYQIAVDADFGLDSPEAQLVIRLKMSSKL